MLFNTFLLQSLLAAAAVALPTSRERFEHRVAMRNGGVRSSNTLQTNVTHQAYSSNWAGAVLNSPAGTYQSVTGTIVVPTPGPPSGSSSGSYSSSAWVGIDGDTCGTAILQTGVDFSWNNGAVSYDAWFEWLPDGAQDFVNFEIAAGDTLTFTVTASSTTSGTASITNYRTGLEAIATINSAPAALCQQDAEWIVEDYDVNGGQVPFADFGSVTFNNAQASGSSVGTVGPQASGSQTIDMIINNQVVTSVSTGGSSVTISYV